MKSSQTKLQIHRKERQGRIAFRGGASMHKYNQMARKNQWEIQNQSKKSFEEKLEAARAATSAAEIEGGEKWNAIAEEQAYTAMLCDFIQAAHNEWKDEVYRGNRRSVPKWSVYEKSRRIHCATYANMAYNVERGKADIIATRLCQRRTCPLCAKITANRNERRLTATLEAAQAAKRSRDHGAEYKLLGLTLTVPNCEGEQLPEEARNISRAAKRMLERNERIKAICKGYIYGIEITRNHSTGLYHPHIHIVLAVNATYGKGAEYILQSELAEIWHTYVRREISAGAQYIRVVENLHQACKYISKLTHANLNAEDEEADVTEAAERATWTGEPEHDADTLYWIETACHRLQLQGTGGILRTKLSEATQDITDEDIQAALEDDEGQHIYMPQTWERMREQYRIVAKSEDLLTAKEVLAYKHSLAAQASEASKAAWARRKGMAEAKAATIPEEEYAARKQIEAQSRTLKDIADFARAGMISRAAELVGTLPHEMQKEAMQIIIDS